MSAGSAVFRIAFVDGVTVSKWARVWAERMPGVTLEAERTDDASQVSVLRDGIADMSFVRLPVEQEKLSVIPLYSETAFVVVAKDHPIALFDSLTLDDLTDEVRLDGSDDDAFALAAAGAGVLVVPQSIARLRSRRDTVSRPVTDAPETRIGLAWREDDASERVEEFIGIVRGRTARSSRGAAPSASSAASSSAKVPPGRRSEPSGSGTGRTRSGATARPGRSSRRPRPGKR